MKCNKKEDPSIDASIQLRRGKGEQNNHKRKREGGTCGKEGMGREKVGIRDGGRQGRSTKGQEKE